MNHKPYSINQDLWMVPCLIRRTTNEYEPLYKPYNNEINAEKLQIRQTWLSYEDEALREIVLSNGAKNWIFIANTLNHKIHKGLPMRQGKQCRERWYNHLTPALTKSKWSAAEDLAILEKQKEIGNKWSEISAQLEGRTENQVKNRYKSLLRKSKILAEEGKEPVDYLIQQIRNGNSKNSDNFVVPSLENSVNHYFPNQNAHPEFEIGSEGNQACSLVKDEDIAPSLYFHT